jgi:D-alanine-D-alanine ligase-like ATP-grasp enzyme
MKPTLISIIIIAILALVVVSMYAQQPEQKQPLPESEENETQQDAALQTYTNTVHGYTLSAPEHMSFMEYTPDMMTVTIGEAGIADVRVVNVTPEGEESFIDAVSTHLQMLCAADGPQSSFSCVDTQVIEPFVAEKGAEGYLLFLRGELTNLQTQEVTEVEKGPYFVFPLQTSENAALVVHAPLNLSANEADAVAIRDIATTVQIQTAQ